MAVERKYERDLDLLLAEEFAVNPLFAERFKAFTKFRDTRAAVCDFWVSKTDSLGESDLIVVYVDDAGQRFALLIEDKIDAPLQPDQASRYRLRADRDRAQGRYADYTVILCAPRYYIESRVDLAGFDTLVALEEVAECLGNSDARAEYKRQFLATAGTKRINAWSREDDPATNEFWDAAYRVAAHEYPLLEMKPRKLTKGSKWILIRPRDFPTKPKHVYVSLKGDRGHIDLTFGNTTAYIFQQKVSHLLDADMSVHQTSASAAVRIQTAGFVVEDGAVAAMPKVREAFVASARLIELYRREEETFDREAKAATSPNLR